MEYVAIVTALALMQLAFFAFQVGAARGAHSVPAPSMDGPEGFLRAYRVHMNTLENVVILVPAMWMFCYFVHPLWSAGLGLVFIISRFMYRSAYLKDPSSRSMTFTIGFVVNTALVVGSIIGAGMSLYKG